jgi:hypothetical protein
VRFSLVVSDQVLCVSDQVLCVSDQVLCVSDQVLCVSDQVLCVSDQVLCVNDQILVRSARMLGARSLEGEGGACPRGATSTVASRAGARPSACPAEEGTQADRV